MARLKKYLILWGMLMRNSLMSQLEYRANFYTGIAMELGCFLAKVVYMIVIFKTGVPINGLTPNEVLVFFGTYMVATGPYAGLYMMNLFDMSRQVQTGELDLLLPELAPYLASLGTTLVCALHTDVPPREWFDGYREVSIPKTARRGSNSRGRSLAVVARP